MKRRGKTGERQSAAQMHALAAVRREIASRDNSSQRKYLREYTQAFPRYERALSMQELEDRVNAAKVILVGDYHALAASQRYAASLVEQIAAKRPVTLCVEAILSRDQTILDSWWRREIGEQELRPRLHFDRDWGYEWDPFYELLTCARDHAEGIHALDCMPREDMRRIRSRDRHAAAKITDARMRHPDAVLIVLFGESHMAPEHLPRLVKESFPAESVLTVLQNVDALYWQAVAENAAAVSIDAETVCVFNSSPLEKYESYRLCLERWNGSSNDETDFAPAVYNVIFSLARTLGFRLDSPHNGTQPKYLADSLPEVVNLSEGSAEEFAREEICAIQPAIDDGGCCYVGESNRFFIREFNMSRVAGEAARFLHHACQGIQTRRSSAGDSIEDALSHFASRLLSPHIEPAECSVNASGEALYQSYLRGHLTIPAVRRLFLSHSETPEQRRALLAPVGS
jgi:hypothetical protein